MKSGKPAAGKIAALAILTALSLIVFIIENQFPPMLLPFARMGLANVFSFAALIMFSPKEGFVVVALRTGLGAVFAGNPSAVMYSFTGGVASMAASALLTCLVHPRISVMAISVCAAVTHNIVQSLIFALTAGTASMLYALPYLVLLGAVSGAVVGATVMLIFRRLPQGVLQRALLKEIV